MKKLLFLLPLFFLSACEAPQSTPTVTPVVSVAVSPSPVACTMDAKVCPDGSAVGRVAPKCEFAACPSTSPDPSPLPSSETSPSPQPSAVSKTENPVSEKDVTAQPAYLVNAYSKNGKNYIDVDYIQRLSGKEAIKKAIEQKDPCLQDISHQGKTSSELLKELENLKTDEEASSNFSFCVPNGIYTVNEKPKVRTFEVLKNAPIEVNGQIAGVINTMDKTNLPDPYGLNLNISFDKLIEATSFAKSVSSYIPESPFQPYSTVINIDVSDNAVTKIVEPFIP